MKRIYMDGGSTLVDDDIHEKHGFHRWYLNKGGYAVRHPLQCEGLPRNTLLHRFIMGFPEGLMVDHINGDRLDNRRRNLRIVTQQQNSWNTATQKNSKTGFKGVTIVWRDEGRRYRASIHHCGTKFELGIFRTPEEAHQAYIEAAKEKFGEYMSVRPAPKTVVLIPIAIRGGEG